MKSLLRCLLALLVAGAVQAHDEVTPKPKLLQKGIPLTGLSGQPGRAEVYEIVIPPDVATLTFSTSGGSGDCDIYVRRGAHPTDESYDFKSDFSGNRENVTVDAPLDGPWYVLVSAFSVFHGVKLKAAYTLQPGAIAVPVLRPAPGVFGTEATVRLNDATASSVLRYTLDETPVTATSPVYAGPLHFTATTHLRVAAFKNGAASPEVDAYYIVVPAGDVTELKSGQPLFHRSGNLGSRQMFKVTVPAIQGVLRVHTEGGTGQTDVFIRQGAPPTPRLYDKRINGPGNRGNLDIKNPAAGDWYILLRGRADFSGLAIMAMARPNQPDLIVWRDSINPYLSVETFTAADCEYQEGMIDIGTHTLLRFNTETRNIGGTDLVMPSPINNPLFEYAQCHGHYHFKGFASYRLLQKDGTPVAIGKKVSFCLEDIERWDPQAKLKSHFVCSQQGIQSGWADIYDGGLPGQWIDITGVPDGTYDLEITMDPLHVLDEADYANNGELIEVVLDTTGLLDPALPRSARRIVFRP